MNPEVVARQMGYIEEQLWYELTPESLLSYIQALERTFQIMEHNIHETRGKAG